MHTIFFKIVPWWEKKLKIWIFNFLACSCPPICATTHAPRVDSDLFMHRGLKLGDHHHLNPYSYHHHLNHQIHHHHHHHLALNHLTHHHNQDSRRKWGLNWCSSTPARAPTSHLHSPNAAIKIKDANVLASSHHFSQNAIKIKNASLLSSPSWTILIANTLAVLFS